MIYLICSRCEIFGLKNETPIPAVAQLKIPLASSFYCCLPFSLFLLVFFTMCIRVGELEERLTVFINRSFESLTSIEQSLALLEKYQTVLHREAMRHDLSSKVGCASSLKNAPVNGRFVLCVNYIAFGDYLL